MEKCIKIVYNLMYNTLTLFHIRIYFRYTFEYISTIIRANCTFSIIIKSSSKSVCIYSPGMSMVATSLISCSSISDIIIIAYRDNVGDVSYSFIIYSCYFIPSSHAHPLILPSLLSVGNIQYDSTSSLPIFRYLYGIKWGKCLHVMELFQL